MMQKLASVCRNSLVYVEPVPCTVEKGRCAHSGIRVGSGDGPGRVQVNSGWYRGGSGEGPGKFRVVPGWVRGRSRNGLGKFQVVLPKLKLA